jgi:DNA repair protein REV1
MGSKLEATSSAVRKKIEKHRFDDEGGEEYGASNFGGFADYFRRKKIKLQNLDADRRSKSGNKSPIFRGVVAHVNGYTQPSLNDLHHLIVDYGGGFMQYLDGKTAVTHIIASSLTPRKKVEFRNYRIVKPAWVVDSVNAGKLLPWDAYRVIDEGGGQKVLAFDGGNVISQSSSQRAGYRDQTDTSWYTQQIKSVADELDGGGRGKLLSSEPPTESKTIFNNDVAIEEQEFEDSEEEVLKSELGGTSRSPFDSVSDGVDDVGDPENILQQKWSKEDVHLVEPAPPTTSTANPDTNNWIAKEDMHTTPYIGVSEMRLAGEVLTRDKSTEEFTRDNKKPKLTAEEHNAALLADPKKRKSTAVNPEFLKQYYEESRLHHLSTWKAELKSQLQALAAEKSSSQKAREKRRPGSRRYILHVDFDCFFAAVSLMKHPEYIDEPVVVAHGGGPGSEISSCNYVARKFGVKNGMWMKAARKICPDIKVLPYDFKAYEEASRDFYETLLDTGCIVQSVSIDEALVDVSNFCVAADEPSATGGSEESVTREQAKADAIALEIRETIRSKTGCAVSVGIGGNILLAKLAMRKAKPAGQYQIKPKEVLDFVGQLRVQDLPGVASSIGGKLEDIGVKYVNDVRKLSKERLMVVLGPKTGEKIWDYSRGVDRVEVGEQVVRKSVSAEVNWGIRFATQEQAEEFVQSLCDELHQRLLNEKVKGRQLTLKIMRRASDAPLEPPKHLGHGKCDTCNKSVILGVATNDRTVLGQEAISIMRGWAISPGELRGIGVQLTKLEPLKGTIESPVPSSQKRLEFSTSNPPKSPFLLEELDDDLESPRKLHATASHPAAAFAIEKSPSGRRYQPLNTHGTQFILPSQVDPDVLGELPDDVRSKFVVPKHATISSPLGEHSPDVKPRTNSPALPSDALPSHSQLDQETLDALPSDVRAEVLAFYHNPPAKALAQGLLPGSPRKVRSITNKLKKPTTPTKKRGGLLSRGRNAAKGSSLSTLTQSNFIAKDNSEIDAVAEVPPEFLSALPEDIRREVLDQARRDRLQKKGGIDITAKRPAKSSRLTQPPPGQRRLRLSPRPPKPTFTAQKLTSLADLREAVSAWVEEFKDEGPYPDDVDALIRYLKKVVGDEESDMAKAVGVIRWLRWVVGEKANVEKGKVEWEKAVGRVEEGVQEVVKRRGLGKIVF